MDDFEAVYEEYREMIFKFLYRLCRNESLAEELTQETLYQAMMGWKRFRGNSSISTWLCAIAKRLYYGLLRKPFAQPLPEGRPSDAPDIVDALVESDRRMAAQHMLHNLPDPYKEVFTLRTFCGLDHEQVGELFGKSANWARVTYYRARQMLITRMNEEELD